MDIKETNKFYGTVKQVELDVENKRVMDERYNEIRQICRDQLFDVITDLKEIFGKQLDVGERRTNCGEVFIKSNNGSTHALDVLMGTIDVSINITGKGYGEQFEYRFSDDIDTIQQKYMTALHTFVFRALQYDRGVLDQSHSGVVHV